MRVPALLAAALTAGVLAWSGTAAVSAADAAPAATPVTDQPDSKTGPTRVIAVLDTEGGISKRPDRAEIRETRAEVLADLPVGGFDVVATYNRLPMVSLEADAETRAALEADPRVLAVQEDSVVSTTMLEANALTGVNDVKATGITGAGITAAIIDTGVDSNAGVVHPGLADDLVGQHCFRSESDCINSVDSAEDQVGHGTHVAGIITGPNGVAPAAKFYALKVFTTGNTSDTNILSALNYVIGLNSTTPGTVDLVNLSLGGGAYADRAACNAARAAYKTAFASLNGQGVTVFASTGNDAYTAAVGAPGCVDGAVGVGSTGDATFGPLNFTACTDNGAADKVSCYSNATPVQGTDELVDLVAPGCRITSLGLNEGTSTIMCGTSMASPYALGTAALVLDYADGHGDTLTPASLETLLEATGKPISDYRNANSPTFPRVAPAKAIAALALGAPTGLKLTGSTTSSASFSWTGRPGAIHYQLVRTSAASGLTTTVPTTGTGTTFTDDPAACGPLTYAVQAVDVDGNASTSSNEVTATLRACPAPPTNVTLTKVDADTQTVAWTPAAGATSVVLQRRTPPAAFTDYISINIQTQFEDTVAACGPVEYRVITTAANGDRSTPSAGVGRALCSPANDDLADAKTLTVGAAGATTTETEPNVKYAGQEAGDPPFSCRTGGTGVGNDGIWYRIVPTVDVRVTVSTATSTLSSADTLLAVYRGTPSLANEVACNDDITAQNFRSAAIGNLRAGSTYYVHVAHFSSVAAGATGNLITTFGWAAPVPTPANDDYAARTPITTSPYALAVPNAQNATVAGTDPAHTCRRTGAGVGTATLWWSFTPTTNGTLDLDTLTSSGSSTDTILSVHTGQPGSFASVACNDDSAADTQLSKLDDVPVTAGTEYSIQVSRWSPDATVTDGTAVLHATFATAPALQLSKTSLAMTEGQPGDTYTARLAGSPTADVTVTTLGNADCTVSPSSLTFTPANFATPQTITVTAPDDGLVEPTESCPITHTLASSDLGYSGLAAPTVTGTVTDAPVPTVPPVIPVIPVTPAAGRPDARLGGPGPLVGDGSYGAGQTKTVKAKKKATFTVSLQNDSPAADSLTLKGGASAKGFTVRYLAPDGADITKAVLAGTFATPSLAPGATYDVTVVVKVTKKAKGKLSITATTTSVRTPTATDTVGLVTKRKK